MNAKPPLVTTSDVVTAGCTGSTGATLDAAGVLNSVGSSVGNGGGGGTLRLTVVLAELGECSGSGAVECGAGVVELAGVVLGGHGVLVDDTLDDSGG